MLVFVHVCKAYCVCTNHVAHAQRTYLQHGDSALPRRLVPEGRQEVVGIHKNVHACVEGRTDQHHADISHEPRASRSQHDKMVEDMQEADLVAEGHMDQSVHKFVHLGHQQHKEHEVFELTADSRGGAR